MSYKDAMEELEQILADLNNEGTDIDQLAKKLERATELIKFCKGKLRSTEEQIKGILEEED